MKTALVCATLLLSFFGHAQAKESNSNELIPFHFEKSGVQVSIVFRHSMTYASTRNLMLVPAEDIQPNPFLSFEYLPSDKYYACATKQLGLLGEALKSSAVTPHKNRFQSIQLSIMINPSPAATTLCVPQVRSLAKFLFLHTCLDESSSVDQGCQPLKTADIISQYTGREDMAKNRQAAESRMKNAAEDILERIKP